MDRRGKIINNPYEASAHEALEAVAVKCSNRLPLLRNA
jgi:hypothetical protein